MTPDRLAAGLVLGLVLDGTAQAEPARIAEQARAAEAAGLGIVVFDDQQGAPAEPGEGWGLDPIETASFVAALTERVGLVTTAAATYAEPFHLSNRLSSLDWGSSGRAGWLVTVDTSAERAQAYSVPAAPDPEAARAEAEAVLDAAQRLWDSWEDGALIADSARGRFLDRDKLHYISEGEAATGGGLFSIRGPALMPRPVQGQVVVLARAVDRLAGTDVALVGGTSADELAASASAARVAGAPRALAEVAVGAGAVSWSELGGLLRRLVGRVDGVLLRAAGTDEALDRLSRDVLPRLVEDGTTHPPEPGQTLRQQLGLSRPPSRYAAADTATGGQT